MLDHPVAPAEAAGHLSHCIVLCNLCSGQVLDKERKRDDAMWARYQEKCRVCLGLSSTGCYVGFPGHSGLGSAERPSGTLSKTTPDDDAMTRLKNGNVVCHVCAQTRLVCMY